MSTYVPQMQPQQGQLGVPTYAPYPMSYVLPIQKRLAFKVLAIASFAFFMLFISWFAVLLIINYFAYGIYNQLFDDLSTLLLDIVLGVLYIDAVVIIVSGIVTLVIKPTKQLSYPSSFSPGFPSAYPVSAQQPDAYPQSVPQSSQYSAYMMQHKVPILERKAFKFCIIALLAFCFGAMFILLLAFGKSILESILPRAVMSVLSDDITAWAWLTIMLASTLTIIVSGIVTLASER